MKARYPRPKIPTIKQEVRFRDLPLGQPFKFYSGLDLLLVKCGPTSAQYANGTVDLVEATDARVYQAGFPRTSPRASAGIPLRPKGWTAFLVHLLKQKLR